MKYVPEADPKKNSFEILAEIILQLVVMFVGFFMVHRLVTFVPTYSGDSYSEYHPLTNILSTIMVVCSLQTKLGEKVTILVDRLSDLWDGSSSSSSSSKKKQSGGSSGGGGGGASGGGSSSSSTQSGGGIPISSLPIQPFTQPTSQQQSPLPQQNQQQQPQDMMDFEPVPANMFGTMLGSSW